MSDVKETFGFNEWKIHELAKLIGYKIRMRPIRRVSSYWGEYFMFEIGHRNFHELVWNEIPPHYTDPDEAAEPEFLDWKCIFWVAQGYESAELTASLLSIERAKRLRVAAPHESKDE